MKKLKRAEQTSDLETENEGVSKKRRKDRAKKIFDSSEDDEPFLETRQHNISLPSFRNSSPEVDCSPVIADNSPACTKLKEMPHRERNADSDFRREVFKKLNTIIYDLRQNEERLSNIEKLLSVQRSHECIDDVQTLEIFPLKTNEELNSLENTLQDKEYYSKLVAALKLLGGVAMHQTVYNIMRTILTNSVAEKYSFLGAKKKLCFKNLKFNKLILASTRARHPDITETEYSEIISRWLVQAKLRLERENSKEEKEKQKQGEVIDHQ